MDKPISETTQPTLLIVDDEPSTRFMLSRSLENKGYQLREAEDGQRALDIFREIHPDLVLLDIQMPELDGISVCRQLRQAGFINTPIIIMTSQEDNEIVESAFEAGATDFITKPINWVLLAQRVRYALRNAQLLDQIRESRIELNKAQIIAKLGHWSLCLKTKILILSQNALTLFNLPPATETKMPLDSFLTLTDKSSANNLEHMIHLSLEDGKDRECETQWNKYDNNTEKVRYISFRWHVSNDNEVIELRGISQDITERKKAEATIERQAYYDHLTNLPNRRLFTERLKRSMHLTHHNEKLIAIMFIDCDRFKPINDSYGHHAGDELLISIACRLQKCVRTHDTVCRISGDEFAILLEGVSHINVIDKIAENIINAIKEPHNIQGHRLFTSVSIGIAVYPFDNTKENDLLAIADRAMYHAKKNGGNQYVYYNAEMNQQGKLRLQLEHDLYEALKNQELILYFQPQNLIDSSRRMIGAEVLLRWQHPEHGLISPLDFIPIAEETGLIVPIGEWIIHSACQQMVNWQKQGYDNIRVSVNISPRQFHQSKLEEVVSNAIQASGIKPQLLDLEITESTSMINIESTITTINKLKKLGVHISLDDFGTGYSSLSYLQKMHIDTLKIDRAFIRDLHKSNNDKAFVKAIITMGHSLGMQIIAEGVEKEEQFTLLREMKCEIAQGYMFSPPVPVEQFVSLLSQYASFTHKHAIKK